MSQYPSPHESIASSSRTHVYGDGSSEDGLLPQHGGIFGGRGSGTSPLNSGAMSPVDSSADHGFYANPHNPGFGKSVVRSLAWETRKDLEAISRRVCVPRAGVLTLDSFESYTRS